MPIKMKLVTLESVRRGDWLIKASILDEQMLIFMYNEYTMRCDVGIFYCEEEAHTYIERMLKNDYNSKIINR
jgi:hypothetical protein